MKTKIVEGNWQWVRSELAHWFRDLGGKADRMHAHAAARAVDMLVTEDPSREMKVTVTIGTREFRIAYKPLPKKRAKVGTSRPGDPQPRFREQAAKIAEREREEAREGRRGKRVQAKAKRARSGARTRG